MTNVAKIEPQAETDEAVKHKGLYCALSAAQAQMGRALKDSKNPHFKSTYADLASVMDACIPALTANGIAVIQPTGEDEMGRFVKTILVHGESGESAECRVPLIVAKNDMQGFGSAVTYARRYGLMSMAGVAPDDDDGNAAAKSPPKEEKPAGASQSEIETAKTSLASATDLDALRKMWSELSKSVQHVPAVIEAKDARKAALETAHQAPPADDLSGDEIPY